MPIPPGWNVEGNPYLIRCPICEGAGFTDEEADTCSACRGLGATATPEGQALGQALAIFYGYSTALASVDHAPEETEAAAAAVAEANRADPETPGSRRRAERAKAREATKRGRKRTAKETDRAPAPTRRRSANDKRRRARL